MKSLRIFVVLFCLCMLTMTSMSMANAQTPTNGASTAPEGQGLFMNVLTSIKSITADLSNKLLGKDLFDRIKNSAVGIADKTSKVALTLAAALALVTLLWKLLIAILSKDSVLGATVETLLYSTICFAVISQYSVLVNQIFDIATSVMNSIGLNVGDALINFLTSFLTPLITAYDNWATQSQNFFSIGLLTSTIDMVGAIILTIAIIYLLFQAIISIVGVFLIGPLFFGVGVIFGPIMIATIVSDYTRQWFGQWLNFLVGSAFLTTVAIAVVTLLTQVIGATAASFGSGSGLLSMIALTLIAATTGKLFESIPGITDAIFPGRTNAQKAINTNLVASAAGSVGAAAAMAANPVTAARTGAMAAAKGMASGIRAVGNSDLAKGAKMGASSFKKGYSMGQSSSGGSGSASGGSTPPALPSP